MVFWRDDLPNSALEARKRICAAVLEGGGNFSKDPEVRTNAVTVWYSAGYHVDLVIYRMYEDEFGQLIFERAGVDWRRGDPREINNWFQQMVNDCSPLPENGARVESQQLRRIAQLLKAITKPRGNLPGGFITTVLAVEQYRSDYNRDDMALYNTLIGLRNRLYSNLKVMNPVYPDQELTGKQQYLHQVERLRDTLIEVTDTLAVLHTADCTEEVALGAWAEVFEHPYWLREVEQVRLGTAAAKGDYRVLQNGQIVLDIPKQPSVAPSARQQFYGDE